MANYYEILEVSEKASKEVIEKAYRVLAKKYHPDGKPQEEKAKAEQRMKQINEAYDVLSNEEKRRKYDSDLQWQKQQEEDRKTQEAQRKMQETYEQMLQEERAINRQNREEKNQRAEQNKSYATNENSKMESAKAINEKMQRAYRQAYNDYWRSKGYKIKEKWTWKKTKDLLKALGIILLIILFLWFFPPTHQMLVSFYEDNFIVKAVVDVIVNIVKGIGTGIYEFILKIFGN